jgi:hypothetical protein
VAPYRRLQFEHKIPTLEAPKRDFQEIGTIRRIDTRKIFIKATFIGKDKSLGYMNGRRYALYLSASNGAYPFGGIYIEREEGDGGCVYGSLFTFFNNWNNIKTKWDTN